MSVDLVNARLALEPSAPALPPLRATPAKCPTLSSSRRPRVLDCRRAAGCAARRQPDDAPTRHSVTSSSGAHTDVAYRPYEAPGSSSRASSRRRAQRAHAPPRGPSRTRRRLARPARAARGRSRGHPPHTAASRATSTSPTDSAHMHPTRLSSTTPMAAAASKGLMRTRHRASAKVVAPIRRLHRLAGVQSRPGSAYAPGYARGRDRPDGSRPSSSRSHSARMHRSAHRCRRARGRDRTPPRPRSHAGSSYSATTPCPTSAASAIARRQLAPSAARGARWLPVQLDPIAVPDAERASSTTTADVCQVYGGYPSA